MHTLEILNFMKKNSPIVAAEKKVFILRNVVRHFSKKKINCFFYRKRPYLLCIDFSKSKIGQNVMNKTSFNIKYHYTLNTRKKSLS